MHAEGAGALGMHVWRGKHDRRLRRWWLSIGGAGPAGLPGWWLHAGVAVASGVCVTDDCAQMGGHDYADQ